ncbi:MAG: hypothetical protein IT378_22730, partial [Sandaracinaceae bacterium]|nr:hypothetical protein [Sandaracinaceae bacterium]
AAGCTSEPATDPVAAASPPPASQLFDASMLPTDVPVGVAPDEIDPALLTDELPQNERKILARPAQPARVRAPGPAAVPVYRIDHVLGF